MPSEPASIAAPDLRSPDPARKRAALHAVYLAHKDEVFGFLVKLLKDRHLAEDVLQESFLRAYSASDGFDPAKPLRPWLFAIVRNAALDALRRRTKRSETSEPAEKPAGDGVLTELTSDERLARARAALGALPDETRALLLQRHGLGMKLDDLAAALGCTERTVRNRLNAAADEFAHKLFGGEA